MGCSPQFSDNFEAMALFMDSKTAMECLNKLSIGVSHCGVGQFKIGFEVFDYNMHLESRVESKIIIQINEVVFKVFKDDLIIRKCRVQSRVHFKEYQICKELNSAQKMLTEITEYTT